MIFVSEVSVGCLRGEAAHPIPNTLCPLSPEELPLVSFQLFEWGTSKLLWKTKSYGHSVDTSFPFFTFHPRMKLFPAHIGEGENHEAMFSLLKATQDFCFWAQKSCCTSPVEPAQEGLRAESMNRGRFYHWTLMWNCCSEFFLFIYDKLQIYF